MVTNEQIEIIREYVPNKFYDQEKLIKYLTLHSCVGNEVFEYVDKSSGKKASQTNYCFMLDREGYEPLNVDKFIRRVPFYFYKWDKESTKGEHRPAELSDILYTFAEQDSYPVSLPGIVYDLEEVYNMLEYLFYDRKISLVDLFNYVPEVTGDILATSYYEWFYYIELCIKFSWDDLMPKRLLTRLNEVLELNGEEPVIYNIIEFNPEAWNEDDNVEFFRRKGDVMEFTGRFPCDENGVPIMKWISMKMKNTGSIHCDCVGAELCNMRVELLPNTIIHAKIEPRDEIGNPLMSEPAEWKQMYAGPQTMELNYNVLKLRRRELGYTQKEVADAVEANVRTYQKWENGETKPDGYYLMRLMNWLDIRDVQSLIEIIE